MTAVCTECRATVLNSYNTTGICGPCRHDAATRGAQQALAEGGDVETTRTAIRRRLQQGPATAAQLAEPLDVTDRSVRRILLSLIEDGEVERGPRDHTQFGMGARLYMLTAGEEAA